MTDAEFGSENRQSRRALPPAAAGYPRTKCHGSRRGWQENTRWHMVLPQPPGVSQPMAAGLDSASKRHV